MITRGRIVVVTLVGLYFAGRGRVVAVTCRDPILVRIVFLESSATRTSNAKQSALPLPTTAPAIAPTRRRVLSSQQGRYKRPKQSGSFSMVASTPSYDSWENRSLEVQKQKQLHEYVAQIHKGGYNRGLEILKAMEKQRSASCS